MTAPVACLVLGALLLAGCEAAAPPRDPAEQWPGGETTPHGRQPRDFISPAANLDDLQLLNFATGFSFFRDAWLIPPTVTANRDGLGPLFNSRSCLGCHNRGGRGTPPRQPRQPLLSLLMRLSVPGEGEHGGPKPHPMYGKQLQSFGIHPGSRRGMAVDGGGLGGEAIGEAAFEVRYDFEPMGLADGSAVPLYRPEYTPVALSYGALGDEVMLSPRMAQPLIGLGLLEAIPAADILAREDPDDADGDGISGRANRVWNPAAERMALGRFGHKAGQATVLAQTAAAFVEDIGITSPLFPAENCGAAQAACRAAPSGRDRSGVEIDAERLRLAAFFTSHIAVPARRGWDEPAVQRGREHFFAAGCDACHVPAHTTGEVAGDAALSGQRIWPYTDLLLHDMGEDLADGRPEFLADSREWRTPPLWGLGLSEQVNGNRRFLHDGRARSLIEAILWHGGEALASREAVRRLDAGERDELIRFLESL